VIFDFANNIKVFAENSKEMTKGFIERKTEIISEILSGYFKP
jgi:hypothetical protein